MKAIRFWSLFFLVLLVALLGLVTANESPPQEGECIPSKEGGGGNDEGNCANPDIVDVTSDSDNNNIDDTKQSESVTAEESSNEPVEAVADEPEELQESTREEEVKVEKQQETKSDNDGEQQSEHHQQQQEEEEDPNCPSRHHVILCAEKYLDTNRNRKLDRSELQTAIDNLPWWSRGILKILGSVDKMMTKCKFYKKMRMFYFWLFVFTSKALLFLTMYPPHPSLCTNIGDVDGKFADGVTYIPFLLLYVLMK